MPNPNGYRSEMRVAIATLGCKVNQVDTAHLEAAFSADGYQVVTWPGPADVVVVNTCTVTALADRQSRQMVKRGRRANPDALVIVTGCAPLSGGGTVDAFAEADLAGNLIPFCAFRQIEVARFAKNPGYGRSPFLQELQDFPLGVDHCFRFRS